MIHRIPSDLVETIDLVPQAILSLPISYFANRYGEFRELEDDFDRYEGAEFALGSGLRFSLRRYKGYPEDTTTIYLSSEVQDVAKISEVIGVLLKELELQPRDLAWQRSDEPHL